MSTETATPYRELFVCWSDNPDGEDYPYADEHPTDQPCDWGWVCSECPTRVDESPCPTHAPTSVPGLRLVECQAQPRHWLFVHDREDYGHGCPWCWYERAAAELTPFKDAAVRLEHRWCRVLNPLKRLGRRLGVVRIDSYSGWSGACWHVSVKWRWSA